MSFGIYYHFLSNKMSVSANLTFSCFKIDQIEWNTHIVLSMAD